MKTYFSYILIAALLAVGCETAPNEAIDSVKNYADYKLDMYPKSTPATQRYIIELPIEENEGLYNLEIWAGQTKSVDCNKHSLTGKFTKKTVQGWGYTYYEFTTNGQTISTRMACPDTPLAEKFIRSTTEHIRYNSKIPIVVYCPKTYEIEYAIWSKTNVPLKAKIK